MNWFTTVSFHCFCKRKMYCTTLWKEFKENLFIHYVKSFFYTITLCQCSSYPLQIRTWSFLNHCGPPHTAQLICWRKARCPFQSFKPQMLENPTNFQKVVNRNRRHWWALQIENVQTRDSNPLYVEISDSLQRNQEKGNLTNLPLGSELF